ncbi:MAG: hypothetical protein NWE93_09615 [Candidatus Bathyarchaeota archaeon]|nr:hypothetical protein [Candidatus Bathyarchaeota archaeon]
MGTCPTCGASSFFSVSTKQCSWCGRTVCNKCVPQWGGTLTYKTQMEDPTKPAAYDNAGFCSIVCFNNFWLTVQAYPTDDVGTDISGFTGKVLWLWNQAVSNAASRSSPAISRGLTQKLNNSIQIQSPKYPAFPYWDSTGKPYWMYEGFRNKAKLTLAQNLERCGRTQDAAKIFEELRMYDKARELRERDRHIFIKKTDVSINLNALLQQVKDGGIVAIFRCPHCGGKLKISDKTTMNSLRICEHCGSEIEAVDLADFLKSALS